MKMIRRSLSVVVVAALSLSGLGLVSASAEEPTRSIPMKHDQPLMAAGVIVTTTSATPSAALLRVAEGELRGDTRVAKVRRAGNRKSVLLTSRRIPAAEAEAVAAELRRRPDVVSVSPNYIVSAFGAPPVITNDTYFDKLKQIWDPRTKTDPWVSLIMGSSNSFPTGGYSSKAPSLWRKTTGTGEVVAVVDTGITDHPDLDNQVLPGYDFVSQFPLSNPGDPVVLEDTGRDGDGRDDDPHDMGDWEDADDCFPGSLAADSSWHGTHVAGIIAAQRDNSEGIVGVAPGVKILPVRVLGLCGGTELDVADGIRWAAGLDVAGATRNENPADVINLSLGASHPCTGTEYASAINAARVAGSVVVAAAGNYGENIDTTPISPATCPGVISVGATSEYGDRAGYDDGFSKAIYSNYGASLDISAPGGDAYWNNRLIISTLNSGATSTAGPTYGQYMGTSMAAPVVSAGAALIRSLGTFNPAQTEAALKAAVAPFPSGMAGQFKKCTTSICGRGIIDLGRVPAPISGPTIPGTPVVGEPLTAASGTWNAKPTAFTYQWLVDGLTIAGATSSTYFVGRADVRKKLSVRLAPVSAVFAPITATSRQTVAVPDGPTVTLAGVPTSKVYGSAEAVTVSVTSGGANVNGPVQLRRGSTVLASGNAVDGSAVLTIPGRSWAIGANNIRAAFVGNGVDNPASSASRLITVAKARSTISTSLWKSVRHTKRAKLTVNVRASGVPSPTGTIRVYDGSKRIMWFNLSSGYHGTRTVTLPRITKRGIHKIKVIYSGNSNILGRTAKMRYLKVY